VKVTGYAKANNGPHSYMSVEVLAGFYSVGLRDVHNHQPSSQPAYTSVNLSVMVTAPRWLIRLSVILTK